MIFTEFSFSFKNKEKKFSTYPIAFVLDYYYTSMRECGVSYDNDKEKERKDNSIVVGNEPEEERKTKLNRIRLFSIGDNCDLKRT